MKMMLGLVCAEKVVPNVIRTRHVKKMNVPVFIGVPYRRTVPLALHIQFPRLAIFTRQIFRGGVVAFDFLSFGVPQNSAA